MNQYFIEERKFLGFLAFALVASAVVLPYSNVALWFGFLFAAYSAVANDSIQTIGTFIASNRERPWWVLWSFVAGIFAATMIVGYVVNDGDVSWGRLAEYPRPTNPNYLQVIAPLFLLLLTRMRMPVSTTILLLTAFAPGSTAIQKVLMKSVGGYFLAFILAMIVWTLAGPFMKRMFTGKAHRGWIVAQWLTTGTLWSVWLMQDAANIAVFLPRRMSVGEFALFGVVIAAGLAFMLFGGGERIQQVVEEKSNVVDTRPATIIDLVYASVLIFKTLSSTVPMSTTWVFIGLLGGRELAMSLNRSGADRSVKEVFVLLCRDVVKASIGLAVSLILAMSINPYIRCEWTGFCNDVATGAGSESADGVPLAADTISLFESDGVPEMLRSQDATPPLLATPLPSTR
jgi:hypothetical protein